MDNNVVKFAKNVLVAVAVTGFPVVGAADPPGAATASDGGKTGFAAAVASEATDPITRLEKVVAELSNLRTAIAHDTSEQTGKLQVVEEAVGRLEAARRALAERREANRTELRTFATEIGRQAEISPEERRALQIERARMHFETDARLDEEGKAVDADLALWSAARRNLVHEIALVRAKGLVEGATGVALAGRPGLPEWVRAQAGEASGIDVGPADPAVEAFLEAVVRDPPRPGRSDVTTVRAP